MSTEYPTIQQHQPLRTPAGWDKQEKALILQLDETFDDIYRRFGRLRMEDMGKKFRKQIADDEGNIAEMQLDISGLTTRVGNAEGDIATLTLTAQGLRVDVDNKIAKTTAYQTADSIVLAAENYTDANAYGKVSGITINSSGIDITGSKYVKIESGCELKILSGGTIDVDAVNFKIDSANKLVKAGVWELSDNGIYSSFVGSGNLPRKFWIKPGDTTDHVHGGMKFILEESSVSETSAFILESDTVGIRILPEADGEGEIGAGGYKWYGVHAVNISYTNLYQNSSREVKRDIRPMTSQGERIDALAPVTFAYTHDADGEIRPGLIYEDTVKVMPEICTKEKEEKAINYMALVPVLLKEVQELRTRIAALTDKQAEVSENV